MNQKFAAFIISRRSVACAVFSEAKLEFWQVRSFQANSEKANSTITSFLNSILQTFEIEAAGLEDLPKELQTRMASLNTSMKDMLREHGIPVFFASEIDLFTAFGEPSLRNRAALRKASAGIFPQLKNPAASKELLDAAALGLHIQTERLLSRAEQEEATPNH